MRTKVKKESKSDAGAVVFDKGEALACLTTIDGMMSAFKRSSDDQSDSVVFQDGFVMAVSNATSTACRHAFKTGAVRGAVALEPLLEIVRRLESKTFQMEVADGVVMVTAGKMRAGIRHDADVKVSYPELPKKWSDLPIDFTSALAAASLSIAKDDLERPILGNVHIKDDLVESTDNKKLTRFKMSKSVDDDFLLAGSSVAKLIPMTPVEFGVAGNVIHFRSGSVEYAANKSTGDFPDLAKFASIKGAEVTFPVETQKILDRMMVMARDVKDAKNRFVEVRFSSGAAEFKSKGARGWVVESVDVDYKGKQDVVARINPEFLDSICGMALSAVVNDKMVMFKTDKMTHIIVQLTQG